MGSLFTSTKKMVTMVPESIHSMLLQCDSMCIVNDNAVRQLYSATDARVQKEMRLKKARKVDRWSSQSNSAPLTVKAFQSGHRRLSAQLDNMISWERASMICNLMSRHRAARRWSSMEILDHRLQRRHTCHSPPKRPIRSEDLITA